MGIGMKIFCNKCSFEKEVYLGKGMSFFDGFDIFLEYSPDIISDSELKRLNSVRRRRSKIDFYKELYHCHKCNNISTNLYVEFIYDINKKFIIEHLCHKCEIPLEVIAPKDVRQKPCPICGENLQINEDSFLWD